MTDKEKLHQILSSLWKNDDSVSKIYYNQALQDVQAAIDLQEEPVSEDFEKKFISFVNATHDNNGSYSLHDFAQRLYNIAKEELKEPVNEDLDLGCGVIWKGEESISEDFEKIVEEIAEPTILNAYGTKELARRLRNTICGTSVS